MRNLSFFRRSLKDLKTTGTISRSSPWLCKRMIRMIDFEQADVIVELGAGDGVITKHILKQMKPNAQLYAFELLDDLAQKMIDDIDDDRLHVIREDVSNVKEIMADHGIHELDAVVSAIPFVILPKKKGKSIVTSCMEMMKSGAWYSQVHYSLLSKKMYEQVFGNLKMSFVPVNIPPAFAFYCQKT